jgi:hypothetical protein
MENTLSQLIPIILTFLFLRYTNISVTVSHTVLGKLFAIALIVFYARIDVILGLFVCLLVIYYYQTDYVEGMKEDGADSEDPTIPVGGANDDEDDPESDKNLVDEAEAELAKKEKFEDEDTESFANYETSYQTEPSIFGEDQHRQPEKQQFVQHHCEHRTLKYKDQSVRPDIAEHIFTEISFEDTPCNICEKGCNFNINHNRLQQEEEMRLPKDSNLFGFFT